MGLGVRPAEAFGTTLLHPTSVHLARGSTSQTEAEAVTAVNQQDGITYDVSSKRRNGVSAVVYTFVVNNAEQNVIDLTDQWNGHVSAPCNLRLSVWNFKARRWVSKSFGSINPVDTDIFTFDLSRPQRFIHRSTLRGKVRCTSKAGRFTFSTDRIRLPEDFNP